MTLALGAMDALFAWTPDAALFLLEGTGQTGWGLNWVRIRWLRAECRRLGPWRHPDCWMGRPSRLCGDNCAVRSAPEASATPDDSEPHPRPD